MPPKSKSKLEFEWTRCDKCASLLGSQRDLDIHRSKPCGAPGAKATKEERRLSDVRHAFILNGTLVAPIVLLQPELSQKSLREKVPKRWARKLLCLNRATMTACGMKFMDAVVVNHRQIFYAFPDQNLPLASMGLLRCQMDVLKCNPGDFALVYRLSENRAVRFSKVVMRAREIKNCMSDAHFTKYVAEANEYYPLSVYFQIQYLGTVCYLKIINGLLNENKLDATSDSIDQELQTNTSTTIQSLRIVDCVPASSIIDDLSERLSRVDVSASPEQMSGKNRVDVMNASELIYGSDDPRALTFVQMTNTMSIVLWSPSVVQGSGVRSVTFDDVGGLEKLKRMLMNLVMEMQRKAKHSVGSDGVDVCSVLLFGPPGTGKRTLVSALASTTGLPLHLFPSQQIDSRHLADSVRVVRAFIAKVRAGAPCIAFIDRLELVCPCPVGGAEPDSESAALTSIMRNEISSLLESEGRVLLLAATSRLNQVNPRVRGPTRFAIERELNVPTAEERTDILRRQLSRLPHGLTESDVEVVAARAYGYVGADLATVCAEAQNIAKVQAGCGPCTISSQHLSAALGRVLPSAMREIAIERPTVSWTDIAVPALLRLQLEQSIMWPQTHPTVFTRLSFSPPKGVLLYGPPGCSKTMLAKAIARESGLNFISIKAGELLGKWVGDSEFAVREVFRKARAAAPSVIFFDELDALAAHRGNAGGAESGGVADRVVAQLLSEMAGVVPLSRVVIMAATNRPDHIDPAIKRAGRFDRVVYVPLPDLDTRRKIFEIHFGKMPPIAADVDIDWLVGKTNGFSGAEVVTLIKEAFQHGLMVDTDIKQLCREDFVKALSVVQPGTSAADVLFYENFSAQRTLC